MTHTPRWRQGRHCAPAKHSLPRTAVCLRYVLAWLVCVIAFNANAAEVHGIVVGVSDGDTLTLLAGRERLRVRLSDIDAPERGQPYGRRARLSLSEVCFERRATLLTAGKDRYGRTLGTVSCEGVVANREQVRRGMAWVYTRYVRRDSPLHAVEADARRLRRGLWQVADPMPPWEWRSRRRAGQRRDQALNVSSARASSRISVPR